MGLPDHVLHPDGYVCHGVLGLDEPTLFLPNTPRTSPKSLGSFTGGFAGSIQIGPTQLLSTNTEISCTHAANMIRTRISLMRGMMSPRTSWMEDRTRMNIYLDLPEGECQCETDARLRSPGWRKLLAWEPKPQLAGSQGMVGSLQQLVYWLREGFNKKKKKKSGIFHTIGRNPPPSKSME